MRILIVEDDPVSAEVLEGFLGDTGTCVIANDGERGLESYQEALNSSEPYQLVCLDIMLPKMDGQMVLKKIRELEHSQGIIKEASARILMTTALGDLGNVFEAVHNDCTGYLVKPILEEELKTELNRLGLTAP